MMRRTHAAAGLAVGFALGAYHQTPLLDTLLIAVVSETASLLPDLDLRLKIKHRTLTHSLLMLSTLTLLVNYALPSLTVPFALGYASHLLLDMLTVHGIELCYPWHRRIRLMSFRTGGTVDGLLAVACLCGALVAVWLRLDPGFMQMQAIWQALMEHCSPDTRGVCL